MQLRNFLIGKRPCYNIDKFNTKNTRIVICNVYIEGFSQDIKKSRNISYKS